MQTQPEAADLGAMAAIDAAAIAGAKKTLRKAVQFRRDLRTTHQRERDDALRMSLIESALADRIPDTVAAYLSCCRSSRIRSVAVSTNRRGRRTKVRIHFASGLIRSWSRPANSCLASSFRKPN